MSAKSTALLFVLLTALCTVIWSVTVNEWLYDCTDAVGLDYLQPGNWVHGRVAVVSEVVHHRSMGEPDTIKAGWSEARLLCLWFAFFGFSIAATLLLSGRWRPSWPGLRREPIVGRESGNAG